MAARASDKQPPRPSGKRLVGGAPQGATGGPTSERTESDDCKEERPNKQQHMMISTAVNWRVVAYTGFSGRAAANILTVRQNGLAERLCDPDLDMYPPPLANRSASFIAHGFDKLQYAVWYLQPRRVQALLPTLRQDQDAYHQLMSPDTYRNIMADLCTANMPTNVPFAQNEYAWNCTLQALLACLTPDELYSVMNPCTLLDFKHPVVAALRQQEPKPLYALIAIHCGARWDAATLQSRTQPAQVSAVGKVDADMANSAVVHEEKKAERAILSQTVRQLIKDKIPFLTDQALALVEETNLPNGKRLLALAERDCPITCEPIQQPVILEDGSIYEESAIMNWLFSHDRSPLTGSKLGMPWMAFNLRTNRFVYTEDDVARNHPHVQRCYTESGSKVKVAPM